MNRNIAYVTCIGSEEQLILDNLYYYYNIGCTHFYIMFNNSNEKTRKLVVQFFNDTGIKTYRTYDDPDPAYRQPMRFAMMSEDAFSDGCSWIVPVDTDEILKLNMDGNISDFLEKYDRYKYCFLNLRWVDYMPSVKDDPNDHNYFTRVKFKEDHSRPQSKIIVKWRRNMRYGDGHHLLTNFRENHIEILENEAFVAHFANRSEEQFVNKRIQIGEAFIKYFGEGSGRPQIEQYKAWQLDNSIFKRAWDSMVEERKENFQRYQFDPIEPSLFNRGADV
jgi:hypothetical protein